MRAGGRFPGVSSHAPSTLTRAWQAHEHKHRGLVLSVLGLLHCRPRAASSWANDALRGKDVRCIRYACCMRRRLVRDARGNSSFLNCSCAPRPSWLPGCRRHVKCHPASLQWQCNGAKERCHACRSGPVRRRGTSSGSGSKAAAAGESRCGMHLRWHRLAPACGCMAHCQHAAQQQVLDLFMHICPNLGPRTKGHMHVARGGRVSISPCADPGVFCRQHDTLLHFLARPSAAAAAEAAAATAPQAVSAAPAGQIILGPTCTSPTASRSNSGRDSLASASI